MQDKYQVVDSGTRRDFETGAHRDMGAGKGRMDLLPYYALLELAKHFEAGAVKYDDNNWRKGIPLKVFFDSALRHLAKMAIGYTDERHDLAALWNIACFIETKKRIELGQLPITLADFPHVDLRDHQTPAGVALEDPPFCDCDRNVFPPHPVHPPKLTRVNGAIPLPPSSLERTAHEGHVADIARYLTYLESPPPAPLLDKPWLYE